MPNILTLARRNVWRNKRRTLITAASILFAVFFGVAMTSIQLGTWSHMVDSVVKYHFGYIQVHQQGFWEEKTIDNSFDPKEVRSQMQNVDGLKSMVPRIESFALASLDTRTKGTLVIGISPELENNFTKMADRIQQGRYLEIGDDGVLVAEGLAEYLQLELGDTLVLISQGYHGINAAGKFPVRGLVHMSSPQLNKQMIYMELTTAQWFYGTGDLVTTLIADVEDADEMTLVEESARSILDQEKYEVMNYKEMLPDLMQARALDIAGGQIILAVLYLIVSFGIFGTLLMMVKERQHEFGILKAIGMKSSQINLMLWLETIAIGIIGCLAGVVVSLPFTIYFNRNPIRLPEEQAEAFESFGVEPVIPTSTDPEIFIIQAIIIFIIISVLSIYPILKINNLQPVKAMRS